MGLRLIHSKSCPDCSAGEDLELDHDKDCPRCGTCGQCIVGVDGWVPSDELHPDEFKGWTPEKWHEHLRKEHSKHEPNDGCLDKLTEISEEAGLYDG